MKISILIYVFYCLVCFQWGEEHRGDRLWLRPNPDCCHGGPQRQHDSFWGACVFDLFYCSLWLSALSPTLKVILSLLLSTSFIAILCLGEFQLLRLFAPHTVHRSPNISWAHDVTGDSFDPCEALAHTHQQTLHCLLPLISEIPWTSFTSSHFFSHKSFEPVGLQIGAPLFHPHQNVTVFLVQLNQVGLTLPGSLKELHPACRRLPSSVLAGVKQKQFCSFHLKS